MNLRVSFLNKMELSFESIKKNFHNINEIKKFIVAYSGGIDSSVLLDIMINSPDEISKKVLAVHINHGISKDSTSWENHCRDFCNENNISFKSIKVDCTKLNGSSLEEHARDKRYDRLFEEVSKNEVLLTAHHQDDQAETLFYQLIRGAGSRGLSCMPKIKILKKGSHIRPLLDIQKSEILEYASSRDIKYINDYTNNDNNYSRNFLRNDIFPLLKERWPNISETFSRSSKNISKSLSLNDDIALLDIGDSIKDNNESLEISNIKLLPQYRIENLLRYWITINSLKPPSQAQLDAIIKDIIFSNKDKTPSFSNSSFQINRRRNTLYIKDKNYKGRIDEGN